MAPRVVSDAELEALTSWPSTGTSRVGEAVIRSHC